MGNVWEDWSVFFLKLFHHSTNVGGLECEGEFSQHILSPNTLQLQEDMKVRFNIYPRKAKQKGYEWKGSNPFSHLYLCCWDQDSGWMDTDNFVKYHWHLGQFSYPHRFILLQQSVREPRVQNPEGVSSLLALSICLLLDGLALLTALTILSLLGYLVNTVEFAQSLKHDIAHRR